MSRVRCACAMLLRICTAWQTITVQTGGLQKNSVTIYTLGSPVLYLAAH